MAKCKDCLHYKVCRTWAFIIGSSAKEIDKISEIESNSTFCTKFKEKAEPVEHGKWLDTRNISYSTRCSECGRYATDITPYCPNCGAKMDGGNENEIHG